MFGVDDVLGNLFALLAGRCGVYRHRRQWRLRRRADVRGALKKLARDIEKLKAELDTADRARPLMAWTSRGFRRKTGRCCSPRRRGARRRW